MGLFLLSFTQLARGIHSRHQQQQQAHTALVTVVEWSNNTVGISPTPVHPRWDAIRGQGHLPVFLSLVLIYAAG